MIRVRVCVKLLLLSIVTTSATGTYFRKQYGRGLKVAHIYISLAACYTVRLENAVGMSTAPIPALAPVMRTVLPSNLDALKMDIDGQESEVIEFNDQMNDSVG